MKVTRRQTESDYASDLIRTRKRLGKEDIVIDGETMMRDLKKERERCMD